MYKVNDVIDFFKNNSNVSTEIKKYIESSFQNKQLNPLDSKTTPLVLKFKLTEERKGKILVKNEYFSYILFHFLKEKLKCSEMSNYGEYGDFIIKAKEEIGKLERFYDTWRRFEVFLLVYFNQTNDWDFKEYVLKFNTKSKSRDFFNVKFHFSEALPHLRISKESLTEILYHLYDQANKDLPFGEVYKPVQEYSCQQSSDGWELVQYLIENKKTELVVSVLAGLSKADFDRVFEYTKRLFHKDNFMGTAIHAFGVFEYEDYKYLEEVLNLFESLDFDEENIVVALARSYSYLVYNPLIHKNKKTDYIFKKLNALAKQEMPAAQHNILFSVFRQEKDIHREKKFELLLNFTKVDKKHKGIIDELRYALDILKEPELILKFIEDWALNHPVDNDNENFSYPLHEAYEREPSKFIENYISLLIHNKGKVRYYANNNSDFIQVTEKNKDIWKQHLCNLGENKAIKFINSILNDSFNPVERMKLVLILIQKKNSTISRYILKRFVLLVHDYGGAVKETVENFLDAKKPFEKKFVDEFLKYYRQIVDFWDKKNTIKEFNPYESPTTDAAKFNEIFYKKRSEDLRKSTEEHSILLKLVTKIPIGRGRKFKLGTNDQYAEMTEFKTTFLMPRTYYIFPEQYDYYRGKNLLADWEG